MRVGRVAVTSQRRESIYKVNR